ncbi:hypothetical protein GGER_00270 [Serratia rubidaea]
MQADSRYRYRIFAMMFFIALINYVDRGALSFAANDIAREFGFNKTQLGAVLGYFGFGYLLGSLCGGVLADRVGSKKSGCWPARCGRCWRSPPPGRVSWASRCSAAPR